MGCLAWEARQIMAHSRDHISEQLNALHRQLGELQRRYDESLATADRWLARANRAEVQLDLARGVITAARNVRQCYDSRRPDDGGILLRQKALFDLGEAIAAYDKQSGHPDDHDHQTDSRRLKALESILASRSTELVYNTTRKSWTLTEKEYSSLREALDSYTPIETEDDACD